MNNIFHGGHEYDGYTPAVVDAMLQQGIPSTMVGWGTSMEPVIPNGSRMYIVPFMGETPAVGDAVYCRVYTRKGVEYTLHMVLRKKRKKFLIGCSNGQPLAWLRYDTIIGKCIGLWPKERWNI